MSLFTFNSTHATVIAERDAAVAKVKVLRKLADERKAELTKSHGALESMSASKAKANRSVDEWRSIAEHALTGVANYSNKLTGHPFNRSPVKKENFRPRFDKHMEHISNSYDTMVSKYEYKDGEFHSEREAKEKVKRSLEDTKKLSLKALERVTKLTVDALSDSGTTLQLPSVAFPEVLASHTEICVANMQQLMEQNDVDASDAEHEVTELKAQKAALEATLKLRDEEIARLKATNASLNTRFDTMASLTAENIVNRYSNLVNSANKRMRLTNGEDQ